MEINQRTIRTCSGVIYEIENCRRMMNKFSEDSKEYAFAFKIFIQLARKASLMNYEGEIVKV